MLQKKCLLVLFTGALFFNSCSSDTEEFDPSIRFSFEVTDQPEVGLGTRGTPTNSGTTSIDYKDGSFKLLAVKGDGAAGATDYDYATVVVATDGSHNYKKNWPDYNLSFYAISPSTSTMIPTQAPAMPTVSPWQYTVGTHTVASNFNSQIDLLWAKTGSIAPGTDVELIFTHILSRITFEAQKNGFTDNEAVKISKITINQVLNSAQGKFNNTAFSWTNNATRANFVLNVSNVTIGPSLAYLYGGTDPANNSMFMIPQTKTDFGKTANITINYTINDEPKTVTKNLSDLDSHDWMKGKWTNYQITITPKYIRLTPITIAGWEDKQDIEINL